MKIPMSEVPEKHPKLVLMFEKETGRKAILKNGKIAKGFRYWLYQKFKYRTLKCNDPTCPDYGKKFKNKTALVAHICWHKEGYRENQSKASKEVQNRPEVKRKNSELSKGEKNWNYGRCGDKSPSYKENAGNQANHIWIKKHYPPKKMCDNRCELCGKFRLDLQLARFIHINVRNMEDPMIDYMYICPYKEKNSCHRIYDDNLSNKEKEKLLSGATTREEKLKRVRKYVLKIKN